MSDSGVTVEAEELRRRLIEPSDFVADTAAFIDVRLPRSQGKASYSFIGPGVSQNPDQVINLVERHGYNVGAAALAPDTVNNPHLHFTAEVFLCIGGSWRFTVGAEGEQSFSVGKHDVFSAPPWVFRGFENVGDEEGFLFVVLGGDEPGGILWAPWVLNEAAKTGLHLDANDAVVDTTAQDAAEPAAGTSAENFLAPMTTDDLTNLDHYSDDELASRRVATADLAWSSDALLSAKLSDHQSRVAPVLGFGMSQDRQHRPPIGNRHGFSMEWLEIGAGSSTGTHRIAETQVLLLVEGDWRIELNRGSDVVSADPAHGSLFSVPPGAWRNLHNIGAGSARAMVVNGLDGYNAIEWDDEIVKAAADAGWAIDANGSVAPRALLNRFEP